MQVRDLEQLKARIEEAKTTKARAEGALDRIKAQWKADFGVSTIEEAEAELAKLDADLDRDEARLEGLLKDLDAKVAQL